MNKRDRADTHARRASQEATAKPADGFDDQCRVLIRALSQATWETDANGVATADSPSWRAYTGQSREEWLGGRWLDAVHPEDRPDALETWREALAHQLVVNSEVRIRSSSGGWRWTNVLATPVKTEDGRIARWLGMVIDVTERKRIEIELKEREIRRAFLIDLADLIRPLNDPDQIQQLIACRLGDKLDADRVFFCDVLEDEGIVRIKPGYDRNGVPALSGPYPITDLLASDSRLRSGETLVIDDTDASPLTDEFLRRGFSRLGIRALVTIPCIRGNRLLWTLSLASRKPRDWQTSEIDLLEDCAWRAWEAIERGQAIEELRSSEERYRALFEFIHEGFCVMERIDPTPNQPLDFRLISVNAAYARQTGIENASGRTLRELFPGEPDDWLLTYDQILRTGQPVHFEHTFQSLGRVLDLYAFRIREKPRDHVAAVFADITDRKRWESAMRESERRALDYVRRLEQADQNKNRFLSTLSHELRNPLAAIVMSFSVLEQSEPGGEQASHAREVIIRQTAQMKRLVDDLLDVTRINQNKLTLKKERIEMGELVQRILTDYRKSFEDKGVMLDTRLSSRPLCLDADPARLTQAIGNLLHNALKFTDTGGRVAVTLEPDASQTQAVLRVEDNGIGMSPELLRDLFQPFTQASASSDRGQGGLGLGLAVVKGMVEQHGGTVTAASEGPGKGSTFTVSLPLDTQASEVAEAAPEAANSQSHVLKAVIIEDNPDLQEILLQLLEMLGHEAVGALDGSTGIEAARRIRPDVILCDIGLPDMNGYEVAQAIRGDNDLKSVYLVALSGYAQPEDLDKSRQAGFDRHLAKPVDLETLKNVLAEASARA